MKTQEIADLQASQKLIEQQRRAFLDQAAELAVKLQARQQADAKAAEAGTRAPASAAENQKQERTKNPFGDFFAKLMEDPDTRKMIRDQQRMMLDQLYEPLIQRMNLTPEEADRFKDLLADNMMKSSEKAMSLLDGSSTNRATAASTMAEEQKAFEEQIRGLLGETRYAEYQDYQQTFGERTLLNQFQQQYGGGENALNEQQTERLLAIMKEERQWASAADQASVGTGPDTATMEAMFSSDATEKLLQSQESINQRVYERAGELLSETQLAAFGKFQTNQLQMMRMGMNMARKFMTPESSGGAAPQPTP